MSRENLHVSVNILTCILKHVYFCNYDSYSLIKLLSLNQVKEIDISEYCFCYSYVHVVFIYFDYVMFVMLCYYVIVLMYFKITIEFFHVYIFFLNNEM